MFLGIPLVILGHQGEFCPFPSLQNTRVISSVKTRPIQNTDSTKCWWGCGATELALTTGGAAKRFGSLKTSLAVSHNTKHTLTQQSSNHDPGNSTKLTENVCSHKNLHRDVYSSFIRNGWNMQPRCPSVGEWTNKLWYMRTIVDIIQLKRNKPSSHEKTQRNLKSKLLSGCDSPHYWQMPKFSTASNNKIHRVQEKLGLITGKVSQYLYFYLPLEGNSKQSVSCSLAEKAAARDRLGPARAILAADSVSGGIF